MPAGKNQGRPIVKNSGVSVSEINSSKRKKRPYLRVITRERDARSGKPTDRFPDARGRMTQVRVTSANNRGNKPVKGKKRSK